MDTIELTGVKRVSKNSNIQLMPHVINSLNHDNEIEVAKLDMTVKGNGGLVTFNLFGLFEVGIFIPHATIEKFIKEYKGRNNVS